MTSLRSLLGGGETKTKPAVFYVFNANLGDNVNDGGRCCGITIPAGSGSALVEMWGGGGSGSGACCCQWPFSQASTGSYVQTKFSVVPGESYIICAGGSTGCSPSCRGQDGQPSYVVRSGGSTCACAHGGIPGCALCFFKSFNCTGICIPSGVHNNTSVGCVKVCATRGHSQTSNFCASDMHESLSGSPKFSQNTRIGTNQCCTQFTQSGCCRNRNHWPGGAGNGAGSCGGGCCWSGWGAGGLVIMTLT